MCWNWIFGFFVGWRLIKWIGGIIRYLSGLTILFFARLYQSGNRRRLDVSRTHRGLSIGNVAGIVLATFIGLTSLCSAQGSAGYFGLGIAAGLYILVGMGRFTLLDDLLSSEEINLPNRSEVIVFQIKVQKTTEWKRELALQMVQQLLLACSELIFQIEANAGSVVWQVIDPVRQVNPAVIEQLIRNTYPMAEIKRGPYQTPILVSGSLRRILHYDYTNMFVASLLPVAELVKIDPLVAVTHTLSELQPGEQIRFTLATGGFAEAAYAEGERQVTQLVVHPARYLTHRGVSDALMAMAAGQDRDDRFTSDYQKPLEKKLAANLYYSAFWIQVEAVDYQRLDQLTQLAHNQVAHFANLPFNTLGMVDWPLEWNTFTLKTNIQNQTSDVLSCYRAWREGQVVNRAPTLILEPGEMAALWHLPHEEMAASRISWARKVVATPEPVVRQSQGIRLGRGVRGGRETEIRLLEGDRVSHMSVVGTTRSGKTNFVHQMSRQDIANDRGVAVISPHRELIDDILRCSIPVGRETDVVLLDIEDKDHPPPMNPLAGHRGQAGMLGVISLIERLFQGSNQLVWLFAYLRAALLLLQGEPQPTMQDVARVLLDDGYRLGLLQRCQNYEVRDFWNFKYNQASDKGKTQISESIIHRLRAFYGNPYLYPVLCHPQAIPFRRYLQENKIILISLEVDTDEVPIIERDLIGALLISQLQSAGMKDRKDAPYYIYVDEAQHFVTSSMDVMLSEAGKKKLSLILANQYLGQLSGSTLDAVLGNVGAMAVFKCGSRDKTTLQTYTQPEFSGQDLVDLDRFEAALKMQVNTRSQPAFTLRPDPPPKEPSDAAARARRIRAKSHHQYTPMTRQQVLGWLNGRYGNVPVSTGTVDDDDDYYG
jgi:hypothetical protein